MIKHDIMAFIHQLELTTRKYISGPLASDYASKLKGSGFEFDQLREYQTGDDTRFIDWKSTARSGKMLVRQYLEDRNRSIIIALDMSASVAYGSGAVSKKEQLFELCAILAFAAIHAKDSVRLVLFTDAIEKQFFVGSSRKALIQALKDIYTYKPKSRHTALNMLAQELFKLQEKNALICILSDFISPLDSVSLQIIGKKHDVIALRCLDIRELSFIPAGLLVFQDAESLNQRVINSSSGDISQILQAWHSEQKQKLKTLGIDFFDSVAGQAYMPDLSRFWRKRICS